MVQRDLARDHFQLVLGQVEHRDAGLSKRRGGPGNELVVADVQSADCGQGTECMGQSTQKVVTQVQKLQTSHFQNKLGHERVIV